MLNLYIFLYSLISLFIIYISDSIEIILVFFYFYTFSIIYINAEKNISDPRVLLLGFFTLYSTFYPLQTYILEISLLEINMNLLVISLKYQFLSIVVFVNVANFTINKNCYLNFNNMTQGIKTNFLSEKIIFLVLLPIVVLSVLFIFVSGASSKREIIDNGGFINELAMFALLIMTAIAITRAVRLRSNFLLDLKLMSFVFLCLFYMLLTGERDVFFRVGFIVLIIYFDKNKNFSFFKAILILGLVVLIVPISQSFKAVLLSGTVNINKEGVDLLLSNEFMAASRNFYSLLLYGVEHSVSFLFNDMIRAFTPSVLLSNTDVQSTGSWFHKVYRVENGFDGISGWGFTIVGTGYLVGGVLGIILIISIYSFILSILYNMRVKSIYWYAFYLLAFTTAIYVIRGDMANFFSQIFKIGGLSILILYMAHQLLNKKKL
jgi:oligosaccharide repeat unit polymerase